MKILNDIACKQVNGAFSINRYQDYISASIGPNDYFHYEGRDFSIGLDYQGIADLSLWDITPLSKTITLSDIFSTNGLTIGDTKITATKGESTFYTLYNP